MGQHADSDDANPQLLRLLNRGALAFVEKQAASKGIKTSDYITLDEMPTAITMPRRSHVTLPNDIKMPTEIVMPTDIIMPDMQGNDAVSAMARVIVGRFEAKAAVLGLAGVAQLVSMAVERDCDHDAERASDDDA